MSKLAVYLIALLSILFEGNTQSSWSYSGANGPGNWSNLFHDCARLLQSPIKIVHSNTTVDVNLGNFSASMFTDIPAKMELVNNGHSLVVDIEGGYTLTDRSVLPADFKVLQFHMHWAANGSNFGSEHWLDGVQTFGELHIVHWNTKFPSVSVALDNIDGFAVLGFFLKVEGTTDNSNLEVLLDPIRLRSVKYDDDTMNYTTPFAISTLLPSTFTDYYRYQGSLTTPPCAESVIWTVFREPIIISQSQAQRLQTSIYEHNQSATSNAFIGGNFRPTLPLNGRKVTRPGSGAALLSPALSHATVLLFALLFVAISW